MITNEEGEDLYFNKSMTALPISVHTQTTDDLRYLKTLIDGKLRIHRMFGKDHYMDDTIIRFTGECTVPGLNMTYAAIKENGRWWLTTVDHSPHGYSWDVLVAQFLSYAVPGSVDLVTNTMVRAFFNKEDRIKLYNLQYIL